MKKKWMKRLLALGTAVLMGMGSMTAVSAQEPEPAITIADQDYYKGMIGEGALELGTININKMVTDNVDEEVTTPDANAKPVKGVMFGVKKIGDFAQISTGDETYMAYGILNNIYDKIQNYISEPDAQDDVYTYFKNFKDINTALKKLEPQELDGIYSNMATTGEDGKVSFTDLRYGLYLVAEVEVINAQVQNENGEWEPYVITEKQYPYVVSVPIYDEVSGKWEAEVNATAKNEIGTATMEKDIVRGYDGTLGPIEEENLKDTDVTEVGDTVEFKLTTTVPDLSEGDASARIDSYILEDNISKGLSLPEAFSAENIQIVDSLNTSYVINEDYMVTGPLDIPADTTGTIKEGQYFKVEFTASGLDKLTALAKAQNLSERNVYTYYTATVNDDAVVGPTGNPNESRLIFSANGSGQITTDWDKVTEYIFAIKAEKTFDGEKNSEKAKDVSFQIFTDEKCTQGIKVNGENGVYVYAGMADAGKGETATEISLAEDGSLYIKGVPVGTELYLKETKTASGWNLLKEPVKIVLAAAKDGDDEYTGYLDKTNTTVNDEAIMANTKDARAEVIFTIDNTSGFQLPSTGGMGAAIFAAIGVLVIALGGAFYFVTSRRARRR